MNPLDDKKLFFDMQEHPENYSDEQLEAMMAELDKEPDTEEAWLLLNEELRMKNEESLAETTAVANSSLFTLHSSFRRIAAVFIAIAFLGIMSLASYRAFFYKTTTDNGQRTTDTTAVKTERFYVDVQDGDTIFRFENIRLDSILAVVSRHYERQVIWGDKAPAHLRLFITCRTSHTLREFVDMMNMFDGFRITQDLNILYVESDEKKEGKQ
ncbi:MAG: DUF4974 domain-containing protein [Bacteroidaceae bacterium]|nr:DUF4974 domain-containing protein [Bacteroidaceae bacterium]